MLTFLIEEGIISVGAISGIFTATLLGSFKSNIIDPLSEKVAPSHKLDPHAQISTFQENKKSDNVLDANNYKSSEKNNHKVKWQTFLKDLITWIIIMFILYIIWNFLIKKIKSN